MLLMPTTSRPRQKLAVFFHEQLQTRDVRT